MLAGRKNLNMYTSKFENEFTLVLNRVDSMPLFKLLGCLERYLPDKHSMLKQLSNCYSRLCQNDVTVTLVCLVCFQGGDAVEDNVG